MAKDFKLYSYFRSSSAYRVRIALNLKAIDYDYLPVHLLKDGGEQRTEEYKKLNPSGRVPALVHGDKLLAQSLAILTYLDDIKNDPRLFPANPFDRARVIWLCEIINSDIQPAQNLELMQILDAQYGMSPEQKIEWGRFWIEKGFRSFEQLSSEWGGSFSYGDNVTAADLYLVPQIYNARRFKVDMGQFPKISAIETRCFELDAFQKARPEVQPDTPAELRP